MKKWFLLVFLVIGPYLLLYLIAGWILCRVDWRILVALFVWQVAVRLEDKASRIEEEAKGGSLQNFWRLK